MPAVNFMHILISIKVTNTSTSISTNKKSQSNLGRATSPPLMAENNYATKSPLVTMGYLTFTPKTALSPRRSPQPSNTPINQPHSPRQTASRSNQLFCHSTPFGQIKSQKDKLTRGNGNTSVPRADAA